VPATFVPADPDFERRTRASFARQGAMALIGQSVVIIIQAHWSRGFWGRDGGFEFPLSLAAGVIAIVGTGAGALSLDALLGISWPVELRLALAALGVVGGLAGIAIARMFPAPKPPETPG